MCGIAGLLDPSAATPVDELVARVGAMADTLHHRGPDAGDVWADPEAGMALGHRRLAIVGLGPGGAQPMASPDGRWILNYNGELYNASDVRDRLTRTGATFRGTSDTEVLVQAVAAWGLMAALDAAEGMFALALWDRRHRRLHLARDRFGEKPLYHGWVDGRFAFASELKALWTLPGFSPEVDRQAVALYLRHNCVPAPRTVLAGVVKLEPGTVATLDGRARPGTAPTVAAYWSARDAVAAARGHPFAGTPTQAVDALEEALGASVAARMVADVPVGAFLSGGIDSSVVVALMQRHSRHPVRTFTIGYADPAFDESADAAAVAAHLGTDHTCVEVGEADVLGVVPGLADLWDEPFGDASQIPTFLVSGVARGQVTVALSGDGGDELFAGYNRHAWLDRLWRRTAPVPAALRRTVGRAAVAVPPWVVERTAQAIAAVPPHRTVRNPASKVAKVGKVLAAASPEDAYLALTSYWEDAEDLVAGAGASSASIASDPASWPALDGLTEQMLWLDLVTYLPDDILTKVDRAAMAVSLETRVPFLDRGVFDLAWRLPLDLKLRDGTTKWAVRQVLWRHVPPVLVERPKMGFGVPVGDLLRGPLRPWAEELLAERHLRNQGLLDPGPVRRAWDRHLKGSRDQGLELWAVLMLEAWLARWLPGWSAG